MIGRILQWNRARRHWNREHRLAWQGYDLPGPSGLTRFQLECETALQRCLSSHGVEFRDRRVARGEENYLHGFIGNTEAEVFIYLDQVELQDHDGRLNLEQWDARTPADVIEAFIEAVNKVVTDSA